MSTLRDLMIAVRDSGGDEKQMGILTDTWNTFVTYFNTVLDMERIASSTTSWNRTTEYLYKAKDEERRLNHDLCIAGCDKINHIAEDIGFDLHIDITDRHQVACFVGNSLSEAYNHGIQGNNGDSTPHKSI